KIIVPTIDEIAARGAVSNSRRICGSLGNSTKQICGAKQQVGVRVDRLKQSRPPILVRAWWIVAVEIVRIHFRCRFKLFEIVHTFDAIAAFLSPSKRGKEHARQDRDDCYHDK